MHSPTRHLASLANIGRMLVDPAYRRCADSIAADREFLAIVAPDFYLAMGTMASAFWSGVMMTRPYVAAPGAREAVLHSAYKDGAVRHGSEFAVACGGGR